ncbi:MAG: two-component regulator propeller domain-containing protein [Verrucomicrobiota bacterium]
MTSVILRNLQRSVALIALGSCATELMSAAVFEPDFRIRQWKTEQGLPHNSVQHILQTRDGYVWVATRAGLARFDGNRFTVFNRANAPAMHDDNCTALLEDAAGVLWVGTSQGLLKFERGTFSRFSTRNGLSHDLVLSLSLSKRGGIWIGTERGLNYFRNGRFENYSPDTGQYKEGFAFTGRIHLVHEDESGRVWIENSHNLEEFDRASGQSTGIVAQGTFTGLASDDQGRFWWASHEGLYYWKDGIVTAVSDPADRSHRYLHCLHLGRSGDIWIYSHFDGLFRIRRGQFVPVSIPSSVPEQRIFSILEDREGSIWIGTEWDGLIQLQTNRVRTFTAADGLVYDIVYAVCGAPDGTLWIASSRGLSAFRNGQFTPFPAQRRNFFNFDTARCLYISPEGHIWGGTEGHIWGVSLFAEGNYRRVVSTPLGANVRVVQHDSKGNLWIGTNRKLFQVPEPLWRSFTGPELDTNREALFLRESAAFKDSAGRSPENVRVIHEDRSGRIWFGTFGSGLFALEKGRFSMLTSVDGLVSPFIQALYEDSDGILWIGTVNGINRLRKGKLASIQTEHGLFDPVIHHILEDGHGHLWISSVRGIYRVEREALNAVADGRAHTTDCFVLGEMDGMRSAVTSSGYQPSGWKTVDDRLWFPTMNGLVVIDPASMIENSLSPSVIIEQAVADEEVIFGDGLPPDTPLFKGREPRSILRLPPGRARVLQIRFTATTFQNPQGTRFRYKLEGYDPNWREAQGNERVAVYTNLRPGSYNFRVKAANRDGNWNDHQTEFAFVLRPFFHQTAWFYMICFIAVAGVAWGIHYARIRGLRRIQQLEQQHLLDEERARIARDMHDELGANLTNVALLAETVIGHPEDPVATTERARKVSGIASGLIDSLGELVWATNPRYDTLDNLVAYLREHAAEWLESSRMNMQLEFPPEVPTLPIRSELRRNLFLILKEALHNARKHSGGTEIRVQLELLHDDGSQNGLPDRVRLIVSDNGKGLDGEGSEFSNGLRNMQDRMRTLKGRLDVRSKPNAGTEVLVEVPLSKQSLRRESSPR